MAHKILIIDDSDNIRSTLGLTLEFKGFEVVEAVNGIQGLERLREGEFDLVFCDLAMPGMGGVETIRRIREDLELNDLPVIVLSAEAREQKAQALTVGATDWVDKPFSPERIFEIVGQYLKDEG